MDPGRIKFLERDLGRELILGLATQSGLPRPLAGMGVDFVPYGQESRTGIPAALLGSRTARNRIMDGEYAGII